LGAHAPLDGAASDLVALALKLPPDLADPIDAVVVGVDPLDLLVHLDICRRDQLGGILHEYQNAV
jgi:hypothetical protein